jgi:hypothetical protein
MNRTQLFFKNGPLDGDFIEMPIDLQWPTKLRVVDHNDKKLSGIYRLRLDAEQEIKNYIWFDPI